MKERLCLVFLVAILIGCMFSPLAASAVTTCDVRILEIATAGIANPGASVESQDMVIVRNMNATTAATVQLVYYPSSGIKSETGTVSLGTIAAGATKAIVSPSLSDVNPAATTATGLSLSSLGGTILVQKTSGAVYCDQIGWGAAALSEGQTAVAPPAGGTLSRVVSGGMVQDSNNNATDFQVETGSCRSPVISELQPFVTDVAGGVVDAWIELYGATDSPGDCQLLTGAGDAYTIPAADMPLSGQVQVINRGLDAAHTVVPFHMGETGGQLWLSGRSVYAASAPVYLPTTTVIYPALERGQTWSFIDGLWRATYQETPYEANILRTAPLFTDTDPSACTTVRLNEVLPNPRGDDTDQEWVELYNSGSEIAMLTECQIELDGSVYGFSAFDGLLPGEYRSFSNFYDSNGSTKGLTLRNSSDTALVMAWQRGLSDGTTEVIQSFDLYDGVQDTSAPEGQSWARFDDGWRWTAALTPDSANAQTPDEATAVLTDYAATDAPAGSVGPETADRPVGPGLPIEITELVPNPAAPKSDDVDEYVELHNANAVAVDLEGYMLQTGLTFNYSYTFPKQVIEPGAYVLVTSGATNISLSNTSGQARLLDGAGIVVAQTDTYGTAPEGAAWALLEGVWKWTSSPTPAANNVFVPAVGAVSTTLARASTVKTPTVKATTTKASASATPKAVKAVKTAAALPASTQQVAAPTAKPPSVHGLVLAAVGLLGVLYAAYEYRTDIANRIYQFRSNRTARRAARARVEGR